MRYVERTKQKKKKERSEGGRERERRRGQIQDNQASRVSSEQKKRGRRRRSGGGPEMNRHRSAQSAMLAKREGNGLALGLVPVHRPTSFVRLWFCISPKRYALSPQGTASLSLPTPAAPSSSPFPSSGNKPLRSEEEA